MTVVCTVCAVACYKRAKYSAHRWRRFWQSQSEHTHGTIRNDGKRWDYPTPPTGIVTVRKTIKSAKFNKRTTHSLSHLPHPSSLVMANHYMDIKTLAEASRKDEWEISLSNLIIHESEHKEDECPIDADLCLRIKDLVSIAWQVSDGL
ncbi:hypothetical protein OSTOST_11974, partial [Ostertagia ostertagi]